MTVSLDQRRDIFDEIRLLAFSRARDLGADIGDTFARAKVPNGVIAMAIAFSFIELAGSLAVLASLSLENDDDDLRDTLKEVLDKTFEASIEQREQLEKEEFNG